MFGPKKVLNTKDEITTYTLNNFSKLSYEGKKLMISKLFEVEDTEGLIKIYKCIRKNLDEELEFDIIIEILNRNIKYISQIIEFVSIENLSKVANKLSEESLERFLTLIPYQYAIQIIAYNDLPESYLKKFIDYNVKIIECYNAIFEENSAKDLYLLLCCLIQYKGNIVKFNITKYLNDIERKIIETKDQKYIVRCALYLDNSLLEYIFDSNEDIIMYLIGNNFSKEDIDHAMKICFSSVHTTILNNSVDKKIESLDREIPDVLENRFNNKYVNYERQLKLINEE